MKTLSGTSNHFPHESPPPLFNQCTLIDSLTLSFSFIFRNMLSYFILENSFHILQSTYKFLQNVFKNRNQHLKKEKKEGGGVFFSFQK